LRKHVQLTGSQVAKFLLSNWAEEAGRFVKVFPSEYKKVLKAAQYEVVR
jgi:glutamate synthase (NADPH/NADH) large chain